MKNILVMFSLLAAIGAVTTTKVLTASTPLSKNATLCLQEKIDEVLAPSTDTKRSVKINCRLELKATDRVTKQILLFGEDSSGTEIKCNGATLSPSFGHDAIVVRSQQTAQPTTNLPIGKWSRPYGITVSGCKVLGGIVVMGVLNNNKPGIFQDSSRLAGHTQRMQDSAPSHISFVSMYIEANRSSALYVHPGSTYVTLKSSRLSGSTYGPVIYLDAESANNTIKNNNFDVDTTRSFDITNFSSLFSREIIAVDGSAYNKIIGNRFSQVDEGGIYIYRNCGEGGIIRHQTPHDNQIINNIFYYNKYKGSNPSIFVSSRDGNSSFCKDDSGYSYGSSNDNGDFATNTAIIENRIYKFSPSSMIKIGKTGSSDIQLNTTVPVGTTVSKLSSSCYVSEEKRVYGNKTVRTDKGKSFTCNDGLWVSTGK